MESWNNPGKARERKKEKKKEKKMLAISVFYLIYFEQFA